MQENRKTKIIDFLNAHYEDALKLVNDFDITKEKKWEPLDYLNELYVQLGHVFNVLYKDKAINEEKRNIDNLGDEISDVLLQLINLARVLNIDIHEIESCTDYDYDDLNGSIVLMGQLTEAIMETYGYRFKKGRLGFKTTHDFIKDRIFKLFIMTYNIAEKHNLDISKEFEAMLIDANGFLATYKKIDN